MLAIHEAHPVRDEGTVVVFEGIEVVDDVEQRVVWFAVDRRIAAVAAQAAEDGLVLAVEEWQVVARTEEV